MLLYVWSWMSTRVCQPLILVEYFTGIKIVYVCFEFDCVYYNRGNLCMFVFLCSSNMDVQSRQNNILSIMYAHFPMFKSISLHFCLLWVPEKKVVLTKSVIELLVVMSHRMVPLLLFVLMSLNCSDLGFCFIQMAWLAHCFGLCTVYKNKMAALWFVKLRW